jgi:hypothetical protein
MALKLGAIYSPFMEGRGVYRERNGWGTQHSVHVATALVATNRRLINSGGKTRVEAAMPRGAKARSAPPGSV